MRGLKLHKVTGEVMIQGHILHKVIEGRNLSSIVPVFLHNIQCLQLIDLQKCEAPRCRVRETLAVARRQYDLLSTRWHWIGLLQAFKVSRLLVYNSHNEV